MFVTLSEYKKRTDSVLKIAQMISKIYDKERFKTLIKNKIDKEITDNIIKVLNDYRKQNNNLPPLTKENLKDMILRNINWKAFWCNLNSLKTTIQNHQAYCLKNTYSELLGLAEDFGYTGEYYEKDKLEKEKRSNPKEYYGKDRADSIEDAVQRLNLNVDDFYNKLMDNFVVEFASDVSYMCSDGFDKEIYGVPVYRDNREIEIKVEKKFLSKKYYPPNLKRLIIIDTFENEVFNKIDEGFRKMKEYGVVLAGSSTKYDSDWGNTFQLQLIDWVADARYKM